MSRDGVNRRKINHRKILFGFLLIIMVWVVGFRSPVYAYDNQHINGATQGNTEAQGQGDMDVDINLQNTADDSNASVSATKGSSNTNGNTTKVSTNNVGTGLNDHVSKNAKTGDIFSGRNIVIFLLAVGGILIILGVKKRKDANS